jgi:hypothetical protein
MGCAGWRRHAASVCTCAAALAIGACIPGELTLVAGDASAGDDVSLVDVHSADGSGSSGGGGDAEAGGGAHDGPAGTDGGGGPDTGTKYTGAGDTSTKDTGTDAPSPVDASDAGATGCTCIAPVPAGWTLVAFNAASHGPCPTGYGTPTNVIVDPTNLGPSTCSCTCDVATQPNCYTGQVTLTYGTGVCDTSAGTFAVNNGACVAASLPFAASNHAVTPLAPTGGSCSPNVTETPPSPGGGMGKACTVATAPTGAGCSGGQVCAPPSASPFALCIAQSGQVTCPASYPTAHKTGTGVTGGGCGACTCATPNTSCDSPTFSVYSDGACATQLCTMTADGTCQAVTASATGASYLYTATANIGCIPPTQPTPTGNASLDGLSTICCP